MNTKETQAMPVEGVFVGHSIEQKKVMIGIRDLSVILNLREAASLANHIKSTIRRLNRTARFSDGGTDE